jgi:hypothetical protein
MMKVGKRLQISNDEYRQRKSFPISSHFDNMVKKWQKQIAKINSSGRIDIGKIVDDLLTGNVS